MRKAKPRPGRPSLGADGLSRGLTIKVSDALYKQIAAAAGDSGMTIGEWIRGSIAHALAEGEP